MAMRREARQSKVYVVLVIVIMMIKIQEKDQKHELNMAAVKLAK